MPVPGDAVVFLPLPVGVAIVEDVTDLHDDAHADVINPFINDWADPSVTTTWYTPTTFLASTAFKTARRTTPMRVFAARNFK